MFDHFVPEKVAISLVPCNVSICSDPTWLRIPGDGKKGVSNAKIVAAYAEMTLLWEGGVLSGPGLMSVGQHWEPLGMQMHSRLLAPS